jgi:hypothetical protein
MFISTIRQHRQMSRDAAFPSRPKIDRANTCQNPISREALWVLLLWYAVAEPCGGCIHRSKIEWGQA